MRHPAKLFNILDFNKTCNMFLSKIEHSYRYIQFCNYREEFVFKPVNDQLNIIVGCNLSFTRSLNASYFEMDK